MSTEIREKLEQLGSKSRFKFSGKFIKYGFKYSDHNKTHAAPTILLGDIKLIVIDDEIVMTDHLWFNLTKGFKSLGILTENDIVSFYGRITNYTKGYQGIRPGINKPIHTDYKIERPSKVKLELDHDFEKAKHFKEWPDTNWKLCNMIYDMYLADYRKRGILKPYSDTYFA